MRRSINVQLRLPRGPVATVLATVLVSGSIALALPTPADAAVVLPPSGAEPFSIGNRLFLDNGSDGAGGFNLAQRNNGLQDAAEVGVNGVRVELYYDDNGNGAPDSAELVRWDVTEAGGPGTGRPGPNGDGYYLFDDLPQGTFFVVVPPSEFAPGKPLAGFHSSTWNGTETAGAPGATGTPATDLDDDGIEPPNRRPDVSGVRSGPVTFVDGQTVVTDESDLSHDVDPGAPLNEVGSNDPTGWDGPASIGRRTTGDQRDDASNVAVDLGFIPPMSIGNRIWLDDSSDPAQWGPAGSRDNGTIDGTDDGNLTLAGLQGPGIANVPVQLYLDANSNAVVDAGDTLVTSTLSNATGYYLFDGLAPGNYLVRVPSTAFAAGQPLNGLVSSHDPAPQVNPTNQVDRNDNGTDNASPALAGVTTRQVQLTYLTEAVGETDPSPQAQASRGRFGETDADSDLTIDLGFTRPPLSIGDRVWLDDHPTDQGLRNNGRRDAGEAPLPNVQVALYRDQNNNGVVDAGEDTGLRDTTDAGGSYRFDNLPAGGYVVALAAANFDVGGPLENTVSSRSVAPNPLPSDNRVDDNDNGIDAFVAGVGIISSPIQLTYGTEAISESSPGPWGDHGERNEDSDFSVDFGLYVPMSLGNRVWLDDSADTAATTRDNGVLDAADDLDNPNIAGVQPLGVAGVVLRLYRDLDADGVIDAGEDTGRTTTTNATGRYVLDGLTRGTYVVGVEASNFAPGGPLAGLRSSTDATPPSDGGPDGRDKGVTPSPSPVFGTLSRTIALDWTTPNTGTEPVDESDPSPQTQADRGANGERNDFSDLTVDLGFVRANRTPAAEVNAYATAYETRLDVPAPGVLGNDTDPDGDPLTAELVSGPAHGSLTLNPNGSFSYTPAVGYSGADFFSYRAYDGTERSALATVGINVQADAVRPSVTLDAPTGPVTGPFTVEVDFSEAVVGLTAADFEVSGATATLSGSGAAWELLVTPSGSGTVTVALPAGAAADAAGNPSTASGTLTRVADLDAPSVVLSAPDGPVNEGFTVTATFSEPVMGLDIVDLTPTNGTASDLSGSGTTYTFTLTPGSEGPVRVAVDAGAATDAAGNASTASATLTRTYDRTAPTVTLTAAGGPANAPYRVALAFSEPVTGLLAGDLVVDNGTASDLQGSGTAYSVLVTPDAQGPVTVRLPAGSVVDEAGNGNTVSDELARDFDSVRPVVALDAPAGTLRGTVRVSITLSEPAAGLTDADLDVTNGTLSALAGSGTTWMVDLTPVASGPVTLRIAAGAVSDAAGNTSAVASLTRAADLDTPTATLSTTAGALTNAASVTIDVSFSEPVTGLDAADLTVTGGTLSDLTGSGASYAVRLAFDPSGSGATVGLPAGAASDDAGNPTGAAADLAVAYDGTSPRLAVTRAPGQREPVLADRVVFAVTADEPVGDLATTGLTLGGTAGATTASVRRTGPATFEVTATGMSARGSVVLAVAAGAVRDRAGNPSAAAGPSTVAWSDATRASLSTYFDNRCLPDGGVVSLRVSSDGPVTLTASSSDPGIALAQISAGSAGGASTATLTVRAAEGGRGVATVTVTATGDAGAASRTFRVVVGTDGRDRIDGTARSEIVLAGGGDDVVRGGGGRDLVCGGAGDDRLVGGAGRDTLVGQGGDDVLVGGARGDRLVGGPGRDTVRGGPGRNDVDPRPLDG